MNRPLIFGASLNALTNETNPAIRAICNAAAGAKQTMTFRRAIVDNLKSPTGMLRAIKALTKAGTQSASNAQRLARVIRNGGKAPTQRELNIARLNATFRKPNL